MTGYNCAWGGGMRGGRGRGRGKAEIMKSGFAVVVVNGWFPWCGDGWWSCWRLWRCGDGTRCREWVPGTCSHLAITHFMGEMYCLVLSLYWECITVVCCIRLILVCLLQNYRLYTVHIVPIYKSTYTRKQTTVHTPLVCALKVKQWNVRKQTHKNKHKLIHRSNYTSHTHTRSHPSTEERRWRASARTQIQTYVHKQIQLRRRGRLPR